MDESGGPPQPSGGAIRAGDADRERVVALLREHYTAGRLTTEEFDERLQKAFGSRTLGELETLTWDLPADVQQPVAARPARRSRHRPYDHVITYVLVMLFLITIWWVAGGGYFWPIWPMLGWGLGVAFDVLGVRHGGSRRHSDRLDRPHARRQQWIDRPSAWDLPDDEE